MFCFVLFFHKWERSLRTISKPMYGTRPWCLVQAITRHTSPDPRLGSWNCLPHQAHIALSEQMSSIDQQRSSLGSFPTSPLPFIPTLIGLRAFDHVSSRVWWEAATNKNRIVDEKAINVMVSIFYIISIIVVRKLNERNVNIYKQKITNKYI